MAEIELMASKREILGKKVRFLRRRGMTPAHLFGHGIDSLALQCETARLHRVLAQAGRTRLIAIRLDDEGEPRPVVLREIQREPDTGELLHVDFYQVRMGEVVKVDVPIVLIGEAPALSQKENMLVHELTTLTVECLPANIPTTVEADVTSLAEANQVLRVKDIRLETEITILTDPEVVVARISSRAPEVKEAVAAEEAPAEEAPPTEEESKEE